MLSGIVLTQLLCSLNKELVCVPASQVMGKLASHPPVLYHVDIANMVFIVKLKS